MTQNQDLGSSKTPRSIISIGGFNLYNGSIKGTQHKWLNLQKYFDLLRPHDHVVMVRYFTAAMHGASGTRQQIYLSALATLDRMTIVAGRYKRKSVQCKVVGCSFSGNTRFATWEEKRTDVNIAIQMIDDAYQNVCDTLIVVSGDSDLVPPIHLVKHRFPGKKVVVYVPARDATRGAATEIRNAADKNATLPMGLLKRCQLPVEVPDGAGNVIRKPAGW